MTALGLPPLRRLSSLRTGSWQIADWPVALERDRDGTWKVRLLGDSPWTGVLALAGLPFSTRQAAYEAAVAAAATCPPPVSRLTQPLRTVRRCAGLHEICGHELARARRAHLTPAGSWVVEILTDHGWRRLRAVASLSQLDAFIDAQLTDARARRPVGVRARTLAQTAPRHWPPDVERPAGENLDLVWRRRPVTRHTA